jgi:spore coat polysaccharide biosynthesis predicted glycosyltransferase SpsG
VALAKALCEQGCSCFILLDHHNEALANFYQGIPADALYPANQSFVDELSDSERFVEVLSPDPPDWVIVDDYRLSELWESRVRAAGIKVMAIDDLCRRHDCELLLDFKWRGPQTQHAYEGKVSASTKCLLGPEFVLLDSVYQNMNVTRRAVAESFIVMVGMGGGGDLAVLRETVRALLSVTTVKLTIWPVVGPASIGKESFVNWCADHPTVAPIIGQNELSSWYKRAHFYVGAAGGVIYQLMATGLPALTFALSENQQTPLSELESIGHFFHVPQWEATELALLPGFIGTVYQHYDAVQSLMRAGKVVIDGYGAARVANVLFGDPSSVSMPSEVSSVVRREEALTAGHEAIAGDFAVRPVTNRDINAYLAARNLTANQRNMVNSVDIHPLAHYTWWFQARRASYLVVHAEQPRLYIWHCLEQVADQRVLIGGWFVCDERAGQQDALVAVKWQLEHCDSGFPGVPWVAVIHRENQAVRLMNQYLGFKDVDPEDKLYPVIKKLFPDADNTIYHYVSRTTS